MPHQYTLIGIFLFISLVLGIAPISLAWLFSPKKPNIQKEQVYESGNPTFGETWIEFKPQYYMFGLAFVAFDVEVAFLFPWALAYNQLTLYAIGEVAIFLSLLGFSLVYVWRKGWLEWM
ncbi:MAG: NADH-quinone oxidoreductase subunit A [Anaerolineae bacterium]|nr:NADH-quinone oxidoreductase subunit A [Anaerolineae bacterium]